MAGEERQDSRVGKAGGESWTLREEGFRIFPASEHLRGKQPKQSKIAGKVCQNHSKSGLTFFGFVGATVQFALFTVEGLSHLELNIMQSLVCAFLSLIAFFLIPSVSP